MATILRGLRSMKGGRDRDGHRSYRLVWLIESDTLRDGPANVLQTAGLPLPGQAWTVSDDVDVYAWCRPDADVEPHGAADGDPVRYWTVSQTFSTKPDEKGRERCQDVRIENPLLEPAKLGGTFSKVVREAYQDRFGNTILTSSFERVKGAVVEFDEGTTGVWVEQNVADLQLPVLSAFIHGVNSLPMWGLPPRCVKLSNVTWERKFWGTCAVYYTRRLEFDVDPRTFDRVALDEGEMVLNGDWQRDPSFGNYRTWVPVYEFDENDDFVPIDHTNPNNFVRFKDWNGENARVILNGAGLPWDAGRLTTGTGDDAAGRIAIEKYPSVNLFLLGVPAVLA